MQELRLGVLAYDGCFASEIYGVPDLLTMAGRVAAARGATDEGPVRCAVLSPRRQVTAAGGHRVPISSLPSVDVVVVPGFEWPLDGDLDRYLARLGTEIAWLRAQVAAGAAVVSICVGAYLLAEAGLLDGRQATTAWLYADRLARRHPAVTVTDAELVVTDGGVTTTASFSAMYDFALQLIGRRHGPDVARSTARIALVDHARSTQAAYVDAALLPPAGDAFSRQVKAWLDERLDTRYDLGQLARAFHVSSRTMLRRFRDETGQTPLGHLQSARVRRAAHLLETTDRTVAGIAASLSYADPGTFASLFARRTGRRPSEYRATFRRSAAGQRRSDGCG